MKKNYICFRRNYIKISKTGGGKAFLLKFKSVLFNSVMTGGRLSCSITLIFISTKPLKHIKKFDGQNCNLNQRWAVNFGIAASNGKL